MGNQGLLRNIGAKLMNGKTVPVLVGLIGLLFGALVTTLIFSFAFFGELRATTTVSARNAQQIDEMILLVSESVQAIRDHVTAPGHAGTMERLKDQEERLRHLENRRP
jgi:hypothetical protein